MPLLLSVLSDLLVSSFGWLYAQIPTIESFRECNLKLSCLHVIHLTLTHFKLPRIELKKHADDSQRNKIKAQLF